MHQLKVAIIGAGYMAEEHIKALQAQPQVTIAGIFSRTRKRAEALATKYNIAVVADSITELFERTNASAVVVTVLELSMNSVSKEVFNYPWTVLLEKPAGYNFSDAKEIAHNAQAHGKVYVALNRRLYGSVQCIVDDLATNTSARFIHVQDQEDPFAALKIGQPAEVVKYWMYANSVHMVDFFNILGRGKITKVTPLQRWSHEVPAVVSAEVHFSSGDHGLYQAIWRGPAPWAVQVTTATKRWELRPIEQAHFQNSGERKLNSLAVVEEDTKYKPGLFRMAQHLVLALTGEPHKLTPINEALETMKLIHAIYEA